MASDPVLLIHGAWQGSWVWDALAPLLEAEGFSVHAIDLPGNGSDDVDPRDVTLDLYLDCLGGVLEAIGRPVSLVAHSGGGMVATALAERHADQIARIIYIAGMMLPSDWSFADVQAEIDGENAAPSGVTSELSWSADRRVSSVPRAAATAILFSDCPPDLAANGAARLTPQGEGGRAVRVTTTPERFGRVPRVYVEATEDRSVLLKVQRRMQQLVPGATVISLPTGHAPHVSAPHLLAEALLPFLREEVADRPDDSATTRKPIPLTDGASR